MKKAGVYDIKVNNVRKTVDMEFIGSWNEQDTLDFVRDYQATVKTIDASQYTLVCYCGNLNILKQEMIPSLEESFKMYKASGFKHTDILIKQNAIMKMQLNRVIRKVGFDKVEIKETL